MDQYLDVLNRVQRDPRSLSQIARAAGLPLSPVRYALKAKKGPRMDTLEKLAALFQQEDAA